MSTQFAKFYSSFNKICCIFLESGKQINILELFSQILHTRVVKQTVYFMVSGHLNQSLSHCLNINFERQMSIAHETNNHAFPSLASTV